ncbi:MAG: heavy metal translocating P-type ATPase [Leptospirillia bacterium]
MTPTPSPPGPVPGTLPSDASETLCDADFPVTGMTCAACSGRVARALKKLPGVADVSVNLATHRASLRYNPARLSPSSILSTVTEAGYGAQPESLLLEISPALGSGDDRRLTEALEGVPGVVKVSLVPSLSRVEVFCLQGEGLEERLLEALSRAGFSGRVETGGKEAEAGSREIFLLVRDLGISALLSLPLMVLSMAGPRTPGLSRIFPEASSRHILEAALALAVFFGPGRRFLVPGLRAYRHRSPDMNSLVLTGTGAALLYSLLVSLAPALFPEGDRHVYFETTGMVITVILLGRTLEARARRKTGDALAAFAALVPDRAERRQAEGGWQTVPVSELLPGDLVRVPAGERIPADGIVVRGQARVDLSSMTGEPVPVSVRADSRVFCGTSPTDGTLEILVEAVGDQTRLSGIVRAVLRAQGAKLPVEALADRVVALFTPAVLLISLLSFILWLFLDSSGQGLIHGLESAVAVLLVACPCAMGLATPAAVMVATGRAARLGILFRRGESLESLSRVGTVFFDKTGTLTLGAPAVVDRAVVAGESLEGLLSLAAGMENGSTHPLGRAIVEASRREGIPPAPVEEVTVLPGRGLRGVLGGETVLLGSRRLLEENGIDLREMEAQGRLWEGGAATVVYVARGRESLGALALDDPLRPESVEVAECLRQMGLSLALVTGDGAGPAAAVAERLKIPEVHAGCDPLEKGTIVGSAVGRGERVAFVGDGINDAPALASATVGLALSSGTGVAVETADVTLAGPGITRLPAAIALSRQTLRTIRMNLVWAFGYNILLIPLAAGAARPFWGLSLTPMMAGAAMGLSSVLVVGNSLRLAGFARGTSIDRSFEKEQGWQRQS